jgi:DNA-binding HxlR family transcriptional regulator
MSADGPLRYNEISKLLKKNNSITLSTKLKNLVNYGIIEKNIIDDSPMKVEYSLTQKGRELYKVTCSIAEWSERWHKF